MPHNDHASYQSYSVRTCVNKRIERVQSANKTLMPHLQLQGILDGRHNDICKNARHTDDVRKPSMSSWAHRTRRYTLIQAAPPRTVDSYCASANGDMPPEAHRMIYKSTPRSVELRWSKRPWQTMSLPSRQATQIKSSHF